MSPPRRRGPKIVCYGRDQINPAFSSQLHPGNTFDLSNAECDLSFSECRSRCGILVRLFSASV